MDYPNTLQIAGVLTWGLNCLAVGILLGRREARAPVKAGFWMLFAWSILGALIGLGAALR